MFRLTILPVAVWLLASCATNHQPVPTSCDSDYAFDQSCKPSRAGLILANKDLDRTKPLGLFDEAGWIADGDYIIGGYDSRWLIKRAINSAKIIWQIPIEASMAMPVTSFGPNFLTGTRDGKLTLRAKSDGKKIWEQSIGRFAFRRPVQAGKSLLVTTVEQKLFSIDATTGKTNWIYDAGGPTGLVIYTASEPIVIDQTIVLGTSEGSLHGINLVSGKRSWTYDLRAPSYRFRDVVGQVTQIGNSIVFSRYDGVVSGLRMTGGTPKEAWRKDLSAITNSSFRNGVFYVSHLNGDFRALEASSGRELWKVNLGQGANSIFPTESQVYVGGTNGAIAAIASKNGEVRWFDDVAGAISRYPVIVKDRIFFSTGLKALYGYHIR
ncbi:MAG: PQQ-binding-like beta-propeller repeat protein [Pseudobacteriovorax sp.]|nr:PQQ-binding-like beta-propeller repeat protein [Pseudobacteriovorax sp.]